LFELGVVFAIGAIAQLALALWLNPKLVILLAITWICLAGMSKEFFVASWLRQQHVLYMLSHMMIMPLVDLYATSTDWLVARTHPPRGLFLFLLASYFNGLVIEIGRKIRSPQDEEEGVATYSRLWGRRIAVATWWTALAIVLALAVTVGCRLQIPFQIALVLGLSFIVAVVVGSLFLRDPAPGRGKWIERFSGLWTLALYLSLGLLPHLFLRGIH
jgi:4-hydroxybenzoate polyprenyltransferase